VVDLYTVLCYTAGSADHAWEFLYYGSSTQYLSAPWAICSQLTVKSAVWQDIVRYILEQRVFLYDTYVKYVSAGKCRRKFW
jgi:hypothetical protein